MSCYGTNAMNRLASIVAVFALGLLLGFFAARFVGNERAPAPSSEIAPDTTTPAVASHAVKPRAFATRPARHATADQPAINDAGMPATAGKPAHTAPTHALPGDDGTVRIPQKFLSKIQCMVFNTASNCVTDDIVELLGISTGERERLDQLIAATRNQVEAHELDRATVTEQSSTRVVLQIAANPDAGRDVENAFVAGVQETLGDRAASFLERAQPYESVLFSNFGRNDTTLTVTRDENSNLLRVQSQQEYTTPNGGHGSVTSTTMSDQMPDRWKKFFQTP